MLLLVIVVFCSKVVIFGSYPLLLVGVIFRFWASFYILESLKVVGGSCDDSVIDELADELALSTNPDGRPEISSGGSLSIELESLKFMF
jgi:hypothetical protein